MVGEAIQRQRHLQVGIHRSSAFGPAGGFGQNLIGQRALGHDFRWHRIWRLVVKAAWLTSDCLAFDFPLSQAIQSVPEASVMVRPRG